CRLRGGVRHDVTSVSVRLTTPRVKISTSVIPSLARDRNLEALLRRDQVVGILGVLAEVDLRPVDGAGEDAALGVVVVADGRRSVASDVGGLVAREDHRD